MLERVSFVDAVVGLILTLALLRGLWLGLIRESFSIASLGAAVWAVVWGREPLSQWLVARTDLDMVWAPWLASLALVVVAVASVVLLGRLLRRGVHAAGLGWADRAGGALLGALEGALVAALLLVGATALLGRDHPLLEGAQSAALFEEVQDYAADGGRQPDVAAPPRR